MFMVLLMFLMQMVLIIMIKITINFHESEKNIATLLKMYYYKTVKFNILYLKFKKFR